MTRLTWLLAVSGLANARGYDPEACLNSFTEVASNAIARSVFSHCIDVSPATEQRTNEEIEIQDPLTTVRKYCPMEISTKLFHSAFYEILEAGWGLPQNAASPSRYNAISQISALCKKGGMNHTARQKLGYLLASIYDDHLPSGSHCLSMEDKKAAIEDMETTLSKVRNIVGSINFGGLLYLRKVTKPRVQLEMGDGTSFDTSSLKKDGGESGDGTAADQLRILLDKPSIVYMSQSTGAPNAALIVGEENSIDFDLFYRSVLKDTTPGTVMFLVSGEEFPADKIQLVHTIAGNAQNQNILINVILLDPKYVSDQSRAFYHSLAMITGGLLYQSPRRAAHELIPIIESRFQPDQVTIVRNQRIQATRSGVYIDVPVDSTIAELLFEIKCSALRSFVIYNPRYRQHRDISTLVATSDNHLYSIEDVEPGNWQVIVDCDNDFYVEVRGQSPVDFRFTFASSNDQFKATSPFGLDSKKTITEDSDSYLLVHSLGVENVELQSVQFKASDEQERVLPLYSVESLVSAFPMPSEAATPSNVQVTEENLQLAKIEGIDQSGFPVLRTHVLFPTKLMLIDSLDNADFLPGTDTNVTIRVTNAYKEVKIQAGDFEEWIKYIYPVVTDGNKYYTDVLVTISPPATVPTGKMTTVTIIAQTDDNVLLGSLTFEVAAGQRARPSIEKLDIETDISNKFAITKVTSNIRNDHPEAREAIFDALIPPNALITGLKLFVGGEVFSSDIKPAKPVSDEAPAVQSPISINPSPAEHHPHDHGEAGNRKGMTAAHILQRDAHRYEIKMMIDSWDNVTFELTYEELLERTQDRYQHWVSIAPSQIVNNLTTKINVNDLGGIKWIRAYPVQSGVDSFKPSTQADIKWNRGEGKAQIVYQPSPEDQSAFSQDGITGRMMTVFDTDHQRACDAMIQQNYFVQTCLPPKMHLKSNAGSATAPYHVVFALDKSGSMWGTKLDQTKEAFRSMISSLDREARFSIIGFNYATSPWRTRLVKASPYNVEEARGFISRLSAGGGTNMHAALIDAVELCNSERDSPNVPCMILFMTDGTPTVGVTEEPRILTDVTRARSNGEASIAINIIGFGAGISHSFLSRLAATNNGIARQIFEDTDAAFQMQGFFEEVKKFTDTRRAMKSIEFLYDDNMMDYMTYNHFDASKMGAGQEFTVAGKLNGKQLGNFKSFDTQLKITEPSGDERIIKQSYQMKDIDLDNIAAELEMPAINLKSAISSKQEKPLGLNLAERIYRLQVIKQLIRERHMAHSAEEYNEITRKLIDISSNSMLDGTAYLSPVMSMSVAKPVTAKRSKRFADSFDQFDMMEKRPVAHVIQYEYRKLWWKNKLPEESKPIMASVNGSEATFKVDVSNSTRKACFDVSARPGTDFNILKDNLVGLTVSGRSANDADGKMYFNQIRIQLGSETALISIQGGQILQESRDKSLKPLANDKAFQAGGWEIRKSPGKCSIKLGNEIEIILTSTQEATGLEIITYENGSEAAGLIGQFLSRTLLLASDEKSVLDGNKVIPVVENQVGNCYYTDDYTMKFLGRRYYDYIN